MDGLKELVNGRRDKIPSMLMNALGRPFATLALSTATATADIQVNLSGKFILNSDGSRPAALPIEKGDEIGTQTAFAAALAFGNQVLAATGGATNYRCCST